MIRQRMARSAHVLLLVALAAACSDLPTNGNLPLRANFATGSPEDIEAAIAAQERHTSALMNLPGVLGTAVGLLPNGRATVQVFVTTPDVPGIANALENIPVTRIVTDPFVARADPTAKLRPVPIGYSVGHPLITAGTIGARVLDAAGVAYILSNNHVLANSNNASIGDATWQPGRYDGGTSADQIGTLSAFRTIVMTTTASNTMDAAIARVTNPGDLLASTTSDGGYGTPSSTIFGDANGDGLIDNRSALLNLNVMKYGRTTLQTTGTITGVNATVTICYKPQGFFCAAGGSARFVDQVLIGGSTFSSGGDSGSMIVTNNSSHNPVALLFAGSSSQTIANRIDLVLSYFNVTVDDGDAAPPTPVTDVAITSVSAPASLAQGASGNIAVTVRNAGNQPISTPFNVSLSEAPDNTSFAPQTISSLAAGAQTTVTFDWATTTATTVGSHGFTATLGISDDNAANNTGTASTNVVDPATLTGMHVADLGQSATSQGGTWTAIVAIRVHDANHANLGGASVSGKWSDGAGGQAQCVFVTTSDGICFLSKAGLKNRTASVRFTVTNVTRSGQSYVAGSNHDEDGDGNGTTIVVIRP